MNVEQLRYGNKASWFLAFFVIVQGIAYVYALSLNLKDHHQAEAIISGMLLLDAIISILSLILLAVGNLAPDIKLARGQTFLWKLCAVSFFTLLGLVTITIILNMIGAAQGPR
jgi:hypothetical protein